MKLGPNEIHSPRGMTGLQVVGKASTARKRHILVVSCQLGFLAACSSPQKITYPVSCQGNVVDDYHGYRVSDPFRWLEELASAETEAWVGKQNAISIPFLESLPTRASFERRILEIDSAIEHVRVRRQHGWWITRRTDMNGKRTFLSQQTLDDSPRALFSVDHEKTSVPSSVADISLSPDGNIIAFLVSAEGRTVKQLRFYDVRRGVELPDRIDGVKWGLPQWTPDSKAVLYQRLLRPGHAQADGIDRDSVIEIHEIGSARGTDHIIYRANPENIGAGCSVRVAAEGRYVVIVEYYAGNNSVSVLDREALFEKETNRNLIGLTDGLVATNKLVGIHQSTAFLLTTKDAPNGRIVAMELGSPRRWRVVIPERDHLLERATMVDGHICTGYVKDVVSIIRVFNVEGHFLHDVSLPGLGYAFWFSGDSTSRMLTFAFDSYIQPSRTFAHDVTTGRTTEIYSGNSGIQSEDFLTEQVFFKSKDGTRVPMFVTCRRDLAGSGSSPTILYGYGATGAVEAPIFNTDWYAWIESGGTLAVANIRGGGEYGEAWHCAGRRENKQNTFDDFIAAAEYLIKAGYTTPNQLAVLGRSNGGLLVGAVITQRPELFSAALVEAGVLDALRFPSFTAGPRWAKDMGDPTIPEQFNWLRAWSPLHNIRDGAAYPATLISTAFNDQIVHPSQSFKFAAKLQHAQGGTGPILLRVYDSGGHDGGNDLRSRVMEMADRLSFAAFRTGLE